LCDMARVANDYTIDERIPICIACQVANDDVLAQGIGILLVILGNLLGILIRGFAQSPARLFGAGLCYLISGGKTWNRVSTQTATYRY
jgi:glycerol uptake facilitator-like aquaporin